MNSNKIATYLMSGLVFLGTSCGSDFYNLTPNNALALEGAIATDADMYTTVNGVYNGLLKPDLYGLSMLLKGDYMADNAYAKPGSTRYTIFRDYNMTEDDATAKGTWESAYNVILRANSVINSTLPSTPNIDQLKGEAYAIRALMHFELVRNFATPYAANPAAPGVPVVTVFDQSNLPSRNSVNEVYQQIISDLNKAATLIMLDQGQSMTLNATATLRSLNSSYFTKFAVPALLARVYQTMGDWEKAKAEALKVVDQGGFSLVSSANYAAYWGTLVPTTNKVETIFEISFDTQSATNQNLLPYYYEQEGYGDVLVTDDLFNQYAATDVRISNIKQVTFATGPVYACKKFPGILNGSDRDNMRLIRYADVLLTLSEAYANTGDEAKALTILNQVAKARDSKFAGFSSAGTQLKDDILAERRKELAFEGHRFFDFQRLNKSFTHIVSQNATQNMTIAVANTRRVYPIPQAELNANVKLREQQNPGYR